MGFPPATCREQGVRRCRGRRCNGVARAPRHARTVDAGKWNERGHSCHAPGPVMRNGMVTWLSIRQPRGRVMSGLLQVAAFQQDRRRGRRRGARAGIAAVDEACPWSMLRWIATFSSGTQRTLPCRADQQQRQTEQGQATDQVTIRPRSQHADPRQGWEVADLYRTAWFAVGHHADRQAQADPGPVVGHSRDLVAVNDSIEPGRRAPAVMASTDVTGWLQALQPILPDALQRAGQHRPEQRGDAGGQGKGRHDEKRDAECSQHDARPGQGWPPGAGGDRRVASTVFRSVGGPSWRKAVLCRPGRRRDRERPRLAGKPGRVCGITSGRGTPATHRRWDRRRGTGDRAVPDRRYGRVTGCRRGNAGRLRG